MDKSFLGITGFADVFSRFWRQKNPARLRRFAKKSDPFRKPASGFSCPKGCEGRYCMQSIPLAVLKRACSQKIQRIVFHCMQSIPLAVLKLHPTICVTFKRKLHAIHTACGIETFLAFAKMLSLSYCMQSIPLAVLKRKRSHIRTQHIRDCMQSIPLAVLKRYGVIFKPPKPKLHAIHTACGVKTKGLSHINHVRQLFSCIKKPPP